MKHQLSDYGVKLGVIPVKCDNTNIVNLMKNMVLLNKFDTSIDMLSRDSERQESF